MTKAEQVQFLTTNCSCMKGQDQALNALPDAVVEGITTYVEALVDSGEVVNAVRKALRVDDSVTTNELSGLVVNAMKKDDDCEKPKTLNAWLAVMPDDAKPIWNSAVEAHNKEKAAVINELIANVAADKKPAAQARLEKLDLPTLKDKLEDVKLFAPTANRQTDDSGAAGANPTANATPSDTDSAPLTLPTMNWDEKA